MTTTDNLNINNIRQIMTPISLKESLPITEGQKESVTNSRGILENILSGQDKRLFLVVGPCSIHDPEAALEYAKRLKKLSDIVSKEIFIIMRVYFEKPRTTVGWKGLINDPHLNDSFDIETGLTVARQLMLDITDIGLPIGTEALDPISPQYLSDLITWSAIGARTTESQTHREMASGLSSPVGFKNGTDGNIEVAINAMLSALSPHAYLGVSENGMVSMVHSKGNKFGHVILRGGSNGPNHDSVSVGQTREQLVAAKLPANIVVDCSHGNSHKNHKLQPIVFLDIIQQIVDGNNAIKGGMLESNLLEGKQTLVNKADLKYGVSITDACIGWEETERCMLEAARKLKGII